MEVQERDICRLCLGSINGCDEVLLNGNHQLIGSICLITGLEVVSDPDQCEYLCSQCCPLLEQCVKFRETCIKNDVVFRKIMTGSHRVEDSKSEIQNHALEFVKVELINFEEPTDDAEEALEPIDMLPREVGKLPIKRKKIKSQATRDEANRKVQCQECGILVSKCNLKTHQQTHDQNRKKLNCPHCPKYYHYVQHLKLHINTAHTQEIKYTCDQCGKVYLNRNTLRDHVRATHSGQKRYACKVCGEQFARSSMRYYHQRVAHSTVQPFSCEYCDKTFSIRRDLDRHIRFQHFYEKSPKVVEASIELKGKSEEEIDDGTEVVEPSKLSDNQETTKRKRKKLGRPKKENAKNLQEHLEVIPIQEVYTCDQCEKPYTTKYSLNEHQVAMHSGEKRHACKICGERFARGSQRSYHQQTVHSTLRPYACECCDQTFKVKGHLTSHLKNKHSPGNAQPNEPGCETPKISLE